MYTDFINDTVTIINYINEKRKDTLLQLFDYTKYDECIKQINSLISMLRQSSDHETSESLVNECIRYIVKLFKMNPEEYQLCLSSCISNEYTTLRI